MEYGRAGEGARGGQAVPPAPGRLVVGGNGFYVSNGHNYYEIFAGLDNIFKQIRIDFVQSFLNGKAWQNGIRIGLSRLSGRRGDDWP